jgi:hypothetical protein
MLSSSVYHEANIFNQYLCILCMIIMPRLLNGDLPHRFWFRLLPAWAS